MGLGVRIQAKFRAFFVTGFETTVSDCPSNPTLTLTLLVRMCPLAPHLPHTIFSSVAGALEPAPPGDCPLATSLQRFRRSFSCRPRLKAETENKARAELVYTTPEAHRLNFVLYQSGVDFKCPDSNRPLKPLAP
jgi:hypothetical protein